MKLGNYLSSEDKWETIIQAIRDKLYFDGTDFVDGNKIVVNVVGPCGFCVEYCKKGKTCVLCPLYPNICSYYKLGKADGVPLFWQIVEALKLDRYGEALRLAENMLAEIKKHDPRKEPAL